MTRKSASIADRLDAGGITSGREHVAGVVEQLLSPEAYYYAHPDVPVPPDLQRRPFPPAPIGPSTSTVRAWARSVGMEVPDRGALAQRILDAYDAAHAAVPQQAAS